MRNEQNKRLVQMLTHKGYPSEKSDIQSVNLQMLTTSRVLSSSDKGPDIDSATKSRLFCAVFTYDDIGQ